MHIKKLTFILMIMALFSIVLVSVFASNDYSEPIIRVLNPNNEDIWKKGDSQIVKWTTESHGVDTIPRDNQITIRLRKNNNERYSILSTQNGGSAIIVVPHHIPSGKYQVQLTTIYLERFIEGESDYIMIMDKPTPAPTPAPTPIPKPNQPPVISQCQRPSTVNVGETAKIHYDVYDQDNDGFSLQVNWGDGKITHEGLASAAHVYTKAGTYQVTIIAKDSKGAETKKSCSSITVKNKPAPPNNPPKINSCSRESKIVFQHEITNIYYNINDPDKDSFSVKVDWGDGFVTPEGKSKGTHIYQITGNHYLTIIAKDSKGAETRKSCSFIYVKPKPTPKNNPPVIKNCVGQHTVKVGKKAELKYEVYDADGDYIYVSVDWGDGIITSESTAYASHVYKYEGTYYVKIIAKDSKGMTSTSSCGTIRAVKKNEPKYSPKTPKEEPPVINSCKTPVSANVGDRVRMDYIVSDPNEDFIEVALDWKDEVMTTGGTTSARHIYTQAGLYYPTITATDSSGLVAKKACGTILIRNQGTTLPGNNAPVISSCSSPDLVKKGELATVTYLVSDPDGDSVSVQVNWGDSSDSQGLSTLASHTYTSKGIYSVVIKATDSKGAQTFRNCGIIIVSDELATTQENRSAKLKITDVDVKVDKRSDNNLDDNDEISKEAKPGSKVEFKVEVSSLFTNSEGLDIEDVEITITVKDIDDGGDLEETSGKFNLRPRRDKRTTLNFELPLNIEEGLFTVIIEAEGDDEDGNNHFDEIELELEVQKEKHDLRFQNLELSNPKAKCGQIVAINYNLINLGEEDEDGARLIISNSQLDLDFTLNDISLESGTYDNELTGSHTFRIDNDLSPGVYPVNVKTYSDDGRLQSSKDLNLEFFGCDSKEVKIVKQNEAPALNIKQVPITTTFITTEETVAESTVPIEKFAFSVNNRIIWLLLIATLIISIVFVIASMFMLARDDF